jgi:Lytic transglycolase
VFPFYLATVCISDDFLFRSIKEFFYLAGVNSNVKDTQGRSYPGNPLESKDQQYVLCYNDTSPITIRVVDTCPCIQKLPGENRVQRWCCGDQYHVDLSYWAFEKIAHPVYGVIMIELRPVDCNSKEPLSSSMVSATIYSDGPGKGWSWFPTGTSPYFEMLVSNSAHTLSLGLP